MPILRPKAYAINQIICSILDDTYPAGSVLPAERILAEEIGVTYLLGFDEIDVVDDAYKPLGLPASYLISGDGIIVEKIFGRVSEEDLAAKFATHFGL